MIGRTYHRRYGYPWRFAVPAEVAWRIEHLPGYRREDRLSSLRLWGYRWRKHFEHRGAAASSRRGA